MTIANLFECQMIFILISCYFVEHEKEVQFYFIDTSDYWFLNFVPRISKFGTANIKSYVLSSWPLHAATAYSFRFVMECKFMFEKNVNLFL